MGNFQNPLILGVKKNQNFVDGTLMRLCALETEGIINLNPFACINLSKGRESYNGLKMHNKKMCQNCNCW